MVFKKIQKWFFSSSKPASQAPQTSEIVCVFPLPQVLIPGLAIPLHIFEERYKQMTEDILRDKTPLAMSFTPQDEKGENIPHDICGAGPVSLIQNFPDGRKDIFVIGDKRLQITEVLQIKPYIKARAQAVPDVPFESAIREKQLFEEIRTLSRKWIFLAPQMGDHFLEYVNLFQRPHQLADFVTFYFSPSAHDRQQYLETVSQQKRVQKVIDFLSKEVERLEKIKPELKERAQSSGQMLH